MKTYVLGFVFDRRYNNVLLVEKARPEWQAGKLNGLGGKVEVGELPAAAMIRELREETNQALPDVVLTPFGRLRGFDHPGVAREVVPVEVDWEVWLFHGHHPDYFPSDLYGREICGEKLRVLYFPDLHMKAVLPNVLYLVPMARNHALGRDRALFFEIIECRVPSAEIEGLVSR
jgi:8-oxo-dGTP pyrophosphatase MutT (NUDIX family)